MPKERKRCGGRKRDGDKSHPYDDSKSESRTNKRSEWEEIRCPICMEHPHNPRLLVCTSPNCSPYICDTSPTLSHCLTQFMRSSSSTTCPLCRGEIKGYTKVPHGAFSYMNSKSRNCPKEDCEFSGTCKELVQHVRKDHPNSMGPSEVERKRREDWASLQGEIEYQDALIGAGSFNVVVEDPDYPPTSPSRGQLMDYDTGVISEYEDPYHPPTSPSRRQLMGYDTGIISGYEYPYYPPTSPSRGQLTDCDTRVICEDEDPYYPPTSPAMGCHMSYDTGDNIAHWDSTYSTSLCTISYEEDSNYPPTSP